MATPSVYFPDSFNLSDGPVQQVVTSETDPRVVYDGAGLRATDAGGHLIFELNAQTGSGQFTGDLLAAALKLVSSQAGTPPDQSAISWRDTDPISGPLEGIIWVDGRPGVPSITVSGQGDPAAGESIGATLQASSRTSNNFAQFQATVNHPAYGTRAYVQTPTAVKTIYADNGQSDFIFAHVPGQKLRMQAGTQVFAGVGANADVDLLVNLAQAWANSHAVFLAAIQPAATWAGVSLRGALPDTVQPLTRGIAHVTNGGTAQNITVRYLSIGT